MPAVNSIPLIYADEQTGEDDLYLPRNQPKKDMRSKLVRSKERAAGLIVNACPFGCPDEKLDSEHKCEHYVGDTIPGTDDRLYEPLKWRETKDIQGRATRRYRYTDGSDPQPVRKGDQLVRHTISCRVYREEPGADDGQPEIRIGKSRPKKSAGDVADENTDLPPTGA